jgi:hypothetical protein
MAGWLAADAKRPSPFRLVYDRHYHSIKTAPLILIPSSFPSSSSSDDDDGTTRSDSRHRSSSPILPPPKTSWRYVPVLDLERGTDETEKLSAKGEKRV